MRLRGLLPLLLLALNAFGAGRELAPRAIGPTPYWTGDQQTAFAGNRFLTVWIESRGEIGHSIMGTLSDAEGRRLSARALSLHPFAIPFQLVGAGDSFALFWSAGDGMHLSTIDARGNVTGTRVLDVPAAWELLAAWNGERFLLVTGTGAFLLDGAGAVVATIAIDFTPWVRAVSPLEGGFTVVTAGPNPEPLRAYPIANDGTAGVPVTIDPYRPDISHLGAVAAAVPGGTLVVWASYILEIRGISSSLQLLSAVVRRDGSTGPVRVLATPTGRARVKPLHLGRGADSYLLTFAIEGHGATATDLLALPLRSDGTPRGPVRNVTQTATLPWLSAASNGRVTHVVFHEPAVERPRMQSIVIANDGSAPGPPRTVALEPARQSQPALAGTGAGLLAAWTEETADGASVHAASLRPDGTRRSRHTVATGRLASPDVAWNGFEGLVLVKRERASDLDLHAAVVDAAGAPVQAEPIPLTTMPRPYPAAPAAAVWTGDRWLAAWPHVLGRIELASIHNGAVTGRRTLALSTTVPERRSRRVTHVALARNAANILLVWTEALAPVCGTLPPCGADEYRTYAARLTPDGDFAGGPLEVGSGSQSLSVATSGEEFLIVADGTATVVDANARRVLRTATVVNWDAASDVTWNGSAYVVALRYRLVRWYLAVASLDRAGNLLGARHGIETLPADETAPPAIVNSLVALQEGDAADGARAVVYAAEEMAPLPPPPPSPVPRFAFLGESVYEVAWDAIPGAEIYVVEVDTGDPWRVRRQVIPVGHPLVAHVTSGTIRVLAVGPGGASSPPRKRRGVRP